MIDASSFPVPVCNYDTSSSLCSSSSYSSSSSTTIHHHLHGNGDTGSEFSCSPSSTDTTASTDKIPPLHVHNINHNITTNMNKPHRSHDEAWIRIRNLRSKLSGNTIGMEHFKLLQRVGFGDIGTVFLTQLRDSHCFYAMKVMDKEALIQRKKAHRMNREREVLEFLDHPFLPTLYAHFETEQFSCLVMDFCSGGDLHALRHKQPGKRFGIDAVRFYAAEVLLALEYLHMLGVVYRDLKPENVLMRADGHIMLTDFDLSVRCEVNPKLSRCRFSSASSSTSHSSAAASTRSRFSRSFSISSSSHSFSSFGSNLPKQLSHSPFTCLTALHNRKTRDAQKHHKRFLSMLFPMKGRGPKVKTVANVEEPANVMIGGISEQAESKTADDASKDIWMESCATKQGAESSGSGMKGAWDASGDDDGVMELIAEPTGARSMSFVGTHEYLAPEVIAGHGHGSAVDWWTFGIFLYELLYGSTPFKGSANEQTLMNIMKQQLSFPESGHTDSEAQQSARNLIKGLLVKDPSTRLGSSRGAAEIKQHQFFKGVNWALIRSTAPPMFPKLKRSRSIPHHHHHHHHPANIQQHPQSEDDAKIRIYMRSTSQSASNHFDYF